MRKLNWGHINRLKIDERTTGIVKNISIIGILRGVSLAVSLARIPIILEYLDPVRFGVWVTITSVLGWFTVFNIGLGNGLRNRLAEAVSYGNIAKARVYVSTTYGAVSALMVVIYLLFLGVNHYLPWRAILNAPVELESELSFIIAIVFLFLCAQFVSSLIGSVASAMQDPWIAQLADFFGNALSILAIPLLPGSFENRLLLLSATFAGIPVVVNFVAAGILFRGRYFSYRPSLALIRLSELRSLLGLGVKFFAIQVAAIVFYQTNTIIISHLYGPQEVAKFQVGYTFFNCVIMVFSIFLTPVWSAMTDAYIRSDFDWIITAVNRLRRLWLVLAVVTMVQLLLYERLIRLWVGDSVSISPFLAIGFSVYTIISSYNSILSTMINGSGKLAIEVLRTAVMTAVHIPLTLLCIKIFGLPGIMISLVLSSMVTSIFYEVQYRKLLNGTAKGLWAR